MLPKMWSRHGACAVWFLSVPFSSWVLISEIPVHFVLMSVMERLEHSSGGVVSPVWWRIPVLETQRSWKKSSYFSYVLRNPYLLEERFCSFSWWLDEVEKTSCCQSWAQWSRGAFGVSVHGLDSQENQLKGGWCWGTDRKGSKEVFLSSVNWVLERSPKTKQSLCASPPTTESC